MTYIRSVALLTGLALSSSIAAFDDLEDSMGQPQVTGTIDPAYYNPRPMTIDEVAFLTTTACHPSSYNADVTTRICFSEYLTISLEFLAGRNRTYQVEGCPVDQDIDLGYCREGKCTSPSVYDVRILVLPRENWLNVTSIKKCFTSSSLLDIVLILLWT
uniref:Uncharacterized protein n=1 Tax=Peronospora matthiolae TaxID=2874970 RepID=A0AAV1U3V2_9STRA